MAEVRSVLEAWEPRLLSVLRIIVAFVFVEHGGQKLLGFPLPTPGPPGAPLPPLLQFAGILELVGGLLILVGLFTRPVAFILAGEMAVAYFMQHAPHGFWPLANKGESAVLYCFIFLFLCIAGPGPWSLDALIFRRQPSLAP